MVRNGSREQLAPTSTLGEQLEYKGCQSLTMAAIKYEAPDGCFVAHVDHCRNSLVFLASLGCSARFMVKSPGGAEERQTFEFNSGDLLVFDASSEAAIVHAVLGVNEGSCPEGLGERFPVLTGHRYGVQCRFSFDSP